MYLVNYHNHTGLCGHAAGSTEEYIENAAECGLAEIGFADHAPLPLPIRKNITMAPEETELYITEIEKNKNRFSGTIAVKLGFEVDFPLFDTFDTKYLSDPRIDYLIGSVHFIDSWAFDHPDYIEEFSKRDIDEIYSAYYSQISALADSGHFDIIGHFDLIKKFGHRPSRDFSGTIRAIARKISASGMSVEINTSGLLKPVKEIYPSGDIIRIFREYDVPLTLGSDAHQPSLSAFMIREAAVLIKKAGYDKISSYSGRKRRDVFI